jgi:hypothetical protein
VTEANQGKPRVGDWKRAGNDSEKCDFARLSRISPESEIGTSHLPAVFFGIEFERDWAMAA